MSEPQHAQPHQQDDCEDCQKERAQNNKLIDFYERINKIKNKVGEIKPWIAQHSAFANQQRLKMQKMTNQISHAPSLNHELNQFDSKQMGYQLACALLERQIKIKKQNQIMAVRIKELKQLKNKQEANYIHASNIRNSSLTKRDSEMQSQIQGEIMSTSKIYNNNQSKMLRTKQSKSLYSDSLDSALQSKNKNFWGTFNEPPPIKSSRQQKKEQTSRYSIFSNKDSHKDNSTFSSFQETGRTIFNSDIQNNIIQEDKKKFENLNLWLYQYNDEDDLYPKGKPNKNAHQNSNIKSKLLKKK